MGGSLSRVPMFDIGFSELLLIGVVALVVIGPERLPRVARTVGHLLGRLQRYVNDVKADISREMQLDELKRLQAQVAESARELEQNIRQQAQLVRNEVVTTEHGEVAQVRQDEASAATPEAAVHSVTPAMNESQTAATAVAPDKVS
jgi:sec-independent protein translocase protein TatB